MNTQDKIKEGQTLLDNKDNYRPLTSPMVTETNHKVKQLITDLHNGDHIDDMTKKWLCQTPNPPRIPEFYTLTKIHKPSPVGRPIVSGCDGPTEKLSSFVDKLLQPIAQQQKSYLKDTTDFVNFIENTKLPADVILVSMLVYKYTAREGNGQGYAEHTKYSIEKNLLSLHNYLNKRIG